jgi:trimeric autotransporter adhesin
MKTIWLLHSCLVVVVSFSAWTAAQQSAVTPATSPVPTVIPSLINFSGVLTDLNGKPLTGVQGVTFLLYSSEQGGNPLWMETQNVTPGSTGQYSVTLGSTTSQGMPADLFVNGEARWLAVQVVGQPEQLRVMLVAVPYALKAADAQTIGGLPPSAFVLAAPPAGAPTSAPAGSISTSQVAEPPNGTVTGSGTVGYIPLWDTTSDIISSVIFQSGSGGTAKIGINNAAPKATLDVGGNSILRGSVSLPNISTATTSAGSNSQPFQQAASAYNTSAGKAVTQTFDWQAEPLNNDTATASATLNLLFGQGATKPSETGLYIGSNGLINFATGQTFPGTGDGTITGVTAGTDLTGGGSTGTVTLNLDTTKVPQLASNNAFTGTQTINNTVTITGSTGSNQLQVTNNSTSGATAILGTGSSTSGFGVEGVSPNVGVYGSGTGSGGIGLDGHGTFQGAKGISTTTTGSAEGVYGQSSSTSGYGVEGNATSSTGTNVGVYGVTNSSGGYGVEGVGGIGIYGISTTCSSGGCAGAYFAGYNPGVSSLTNGGDGIDSYGGNSSGLGGNGIVATGGGGEFLSDGVGGSGIIGTGAIGGSDEGVDGDGGFFTGGNSDNYMNAGDGISATAGSGWAGYFVGDVVATGYILGGYVQAEIDHPLDPANKYLAHASVGSSEMMNLYTGNITTDSAGYATVQLPDWFEVVNTDFRYQLTAIGQFAQAIIAHKIANHQFQIRTNAPNVEVSWQVTAVRQDAYAKAHPFVVEPEKEGKLRGYYIHPELYGAPPQRQIEWARHPQLKARLEQIRQAQRRGHLATNKQTTLVAKP